MTTNADNQRRFAWDGILFPIPEDWDLASYQYRRHGADLVLEDATDVRLQLEWQTDADPSAVEKGEKRYKQLTGSLHEIANEVVALPEWVSNWSVCHYLMSDGRRLLTAFWVGSPKDALAFLRIHGPAEQDENEFGEQSQRILQGFRWQEGDMRQWRVFDIDLLLPRRFRLQRTSFLAGRKMLLFETRFRRLFVWQFSLASRLLKTCGAAEFASDFLHRAKELPGLRVEPMPNDGLRARRKTLQLFGHYEAIGLWCFHYRAAYYYDAVADTLAIAVFHYRSPGDLSWLETCHTPLFDRLLARNETA